MDATSRRCEHCGLLVVAESAFCCFGCRIAHQLARPVQSGDVAGHGDTLLLRLGSGIFLAMNIMVLSGLTYAEAIFGDAVRPGALGALFGYASLFLCTLVIVLLAVPILEDAVRALAVGEIRTQLLIVIGVLAAFVLSAHNSVVGRGATYYDTTAMVLVAVTLGSYLEAGARRRASMSARRLLGSLPRQVRVRRAGRVSIVPLEAVVAGDEVSVRAGDTVPVDGTVTAGRGHVDTATLTGEATPISVEAGDRLLAASTSIDGHLWLRAEGLGEKTVFAHVERSLERARTEKPSIQRLADRVVTAFVPAVLMLASTVVVVHALRGDLGRGVLDGLSVLLISCPCALGLAAPLTSWHGLRRAAAAGILVDSPATLERGATVDRVFLDKTGTLTEPSLRLAAIEVAPGVDERDVLAWSACLESASPHPIACALIACARARGVAVEPPADARVVAGRGIEGLVGGRWLRLGGRGWLASLGIADPFDGPAPDRTTALYLLANDRPLARFVLDESLRPGAGELVHALEDLGLRVGILSGDRSAAAQRLGEALGIDAVGDLLPTDKVARLVAARDRGERPAMVGDGINDAPVLAAAEVGVAVGSASDLASRSGNVRLLTDRLDRVPRFFSIARDVRRRIRLNLAFAFGFNGVGIVLAVGGRLTPVVAAGAMVLSSLAVVRISAGAGGSAHEPGRESKRVSEGSPSLGQVGARRAPGERANPTPTGPLAPGVGP